MPPGRRVSGTTVRPCVAVRGRRCTRGSPVSGAPPSSSRGTWWARASGSSSSRVGRRCPDSSRDSVLTEIPVPADSWARVVPRCRRNAFSRGPTAASTPSRGSSSGMPTICYSGNDSCQESSTGGTVCGMETRYDVVVVGGGAAGLSGALALARAGRSVLVIDAGEPRNAPASHVHNYLGREGTHPAELYAIGRAEVAGYGGEAVTGRGTAASRRDDGGFDGRLDCGRGATGRPL